MSKRYENTVQQLAFSHCVERCCDLCGLLAESGENWSNGHCKVNETEVRIREGTSHSDGGCGTETTIDICPQCFKTKLIPFIESQGGSATVTEWDY